MLRLKPLVLSSFLSLIAGCSGGISGPIGDPQGGAAELDSFVQDYLDGNAAPAEAAVIDRVAADVLPGNLSYLQAILEREDLTAERLAVDPVFIATMAHIALIATEEGLIEPPVDTTGRSLEEMIDSFTAWASTNGYRLASSLFVGGAVVGVCVGTSGTGCIAAVAVGSHILNKKVWAADEPQAPGQLIDPWLAAQEQANYVLPGTYGERAFYFVRPDTPGDPGTQFAFGDWFDGKLDGEGGSCTASYSGNAAGRWETYEDFHPSRPEPPSLASTCGSTFENEEGRFDITVYADHGFSGSGVNVKVECVHNGNAASSVSLQCSNVHYQLQRHDLY